jgi:hypothetical protein
MKEVLSNRNLDKIKVWSRKGKCPSCGVGTGSRHNIFCRLEYIKKIIYD